MLSLDIVWLALHLFCYMLKDIYACCGRCVGFFDLSSTNNNKHNLRVLCGLASSSKIVPTSLILKTRLPEQLYQVGLRLALVGLDQIPVAMACPTFP